MIDGGGVGGATHAAPPFAGSDAGALRYAVDEQVLHPKHGLGRITGTEEREIGGDRQRYVIVDFERLALTVGIPERALPGSGLRAPMAANNLRPALGILSGEPVKFVWQRSRRVNEHEVKLNSGQPELLAEVLRDLSPRRDRGRDGLIFREALIRFAEELAIAESSQVEDATAKIEALLRPAS